MLEEAVMAVPASAEEFAAAAPEVLRRRPVRKPVTRESLPEHVGAEECAAMSEVLRAIWDAAAAEGPLLARRYRALARLWQGDAESADLSPEGDCEALVAAYALRVTGSRATFEIRDAHHAVETFPECFAALEGGDFPAPWFVQMMRATRGLCDASRSGVDRVISQWDRRVSPERFTRRLGQLVRWAERLETQQAEPRPVERSVSVCDMGPGAAAAQIHGPAAEVHALMRRLDVAARAVQAAQRTALREGELIPWDPDGEVARTGRALRRDVLRYLLITRSELDVQGIDIPAERFRLTVTVPVLTLLGRSEAPGVLDGVTPLPADMARNLAAGEDTWYRVLTDPCSGAFLPLPASRYRPTRAMLEHLRLLAPQCAVPGCGRRASLGAQADHIDEWLDGGLTEIANLHLLCEFHHQEKTDGLIDPVRVRRAGAGSDGTFRPGVTRWFIGHAEGHHAVVEEEDDVDMLGVLSAQPLVRHVRNGRTGSG